MLNQEPGIVVDELPEALPEEGEKAKQRMADALTLGIIFGFLIVLFAIIIIIINIIPGADKLDWLLTQATLGNWILLTGTGLLITFAAVTVCIFIWRKGRSYLKERI